MQEGAEYLRLSDHTIYKLAQNGKIPALKAGKMWWFRRQAIDKWLGQNKWRLRKYNSIQFILLLCCVYVNCGRKVTEHVLSTSLYEYFNSFEVTKDAEGWQGIAKNMYVSDPAPGGGKQSVYIFGYCLQPAAFITLPQRIDEGYYVLSCWAKIEEDNQSGKIVLTTEEDRKNVIQLIVRDKEWTFYKSQQALYCKASDKLRLEVWVGGIVTVHMFIDCIKIEKLK